jgi:hypothetical protein
MSRPSSAELREAGFREDEELVMPLPVFDSSSEDDEDDDGAHCTAAPNVSLAGLVHELDVAETFQEEMADPWLHRALLALSTTPAASLALPTTTRLKRLPLIASNAALLQADGPFATHTSYELPVDSGALLVDVVNRFKLHGRVYEPLNIALTAWALERERLHNECKERLVHAEPGRGSHAGQSKTNVGGYQSYPDVFDDECISPKSLEDDCPAFCAAREMRRHVSQAMDELGSDVTFELGDEIESQGPDRAAGEVHPAYAWLNVNRTGDSNYLHQHDVTKWSAVYYVHGGEPNPEGFPCPNGGKMVFRTGPSQAPRDHAAGKYGEGQGSSEHCTHAYMVVPPEPGVLWLFPGSVPHTVIETVLPPGVPEPEMPRISIGINFLVASHPAPRQGRHAAEAARLRERHTETGRR